VTWAGDDSTLVPRLQQFDDTVTSTSYWTTTTSEYCEKGTTNCIGQGTAGQHVVVATAPPSEGFTDSSMGAGSTLQTWLQSEVTNDPNMPDPTPDTIYALYLPAGTNITLDTSAPSSGFGAYHNTMDVTGKADGGGPVTVAYAVIPRCGSFEATTTISASHEFIEAATDPDIGENNLTFYMYSNQAWTPSGGEVGDLCENGNSSWTEGTFTVQRTWSNASAKASHDPCVPIPAGEVYFNAAPRRQAITLSKVGASVTIPIDAYSDAPMSNWTLSASARGSTNFTFAFDTTSVSNGSVANLTVTLTQTLTAPTTIRITSTSSTNVRHSWPIMASP